ncbi:AraC family transcriptional regulator [Verrucomicrobia bacterium S94]|nr:AraC family transcriptional regulator [Verrucomicrobia bacterium S94]
MTQQYAPIYREQGKTYHADSCDPLIDAVHNGELELAALGRGNYPGEPIPGSILPGLRSLGYWDAKQQQNWGLPWHRNEGIELSFLETGSMPFCVDNKELILTPGDFSITRPWQPHRLGNPNIGIGKLHWIIIDVGVRQPHQEWKWPDWLVILPDDLAELTACLRENEQPVWNAGNEIRDCFRQIGTTTRDRKSLSRLAVYTNELLLHLLDLFRDQNVSRTKSLTDAQRSVELFLESLKASYADEWTLESMAESCGLGVTRFVHYCRQLTNLTPQQYLNQLRLDAAAQLLKTDKSVTDIAMECGFSTSQYFATAFKKQYGKTPREFRKSG